MLTEITVSDWFTCSIGSYVFDSLTEVQAETLLRNYGSLGSYLLSLYDDSNSYQLSFVAV